MNPIVQYSDSNSQLAGGKILFTFTGTNNLKNTFQDSEQLNANANPVILDNSGTIPSIYLLDDDPYRVTIFKADGTLFQQEDDVIGLAGSSSVPDHSFDSILTYDIPDDVVQLSRWYQSISDGNQGNTPTGDNDNNWTEYAKFKFYNSGETYIQNFVIQEAGIIYKSLGSGNLGNTPADFPDKWANISGIGKQTISMPATSLIKSLSNGADLKEEVIGPLSVNSFSFSQSGNNFVQFIIPMPKSWDHGEMEIRFYWFADSTSTESVVWQIQAISVDDDADLENISFPTADTVTDANAGQKRLNISAFKTFTPDGAPVNFDMVYFQISRFPTTNTLDTLAADAQIQAVKLLYTTTTSVDN